MKRSSIRKLGKSPASKLKREIQALLRQIVMARDKTCVLRHLRHCGDPVIQCDHLITRANSATYGDSRLCVALCRSCHGGWKQHHKEQYDALVRQILPKERVLLWDRALLDIHRPQKQDWALVKIALEQELKSYKHEPS